MFFENTEYDDHEIVNALLERNGSVTREFFYRKCYPLFKSVLDNYHTDCDSCVEFMNDIYLHILTPDADTGLCKLEKFKFESTLFTWLKTVCLFYCYKKYKRKQKVRFDRISEKNDDYGVRLDTLPESINMDNSSLSRNDVETILRLMPNRRYSHLIRLRYLEGHTNEETAELMGMNMNTFYNKHKLAKEQYQRTILKEM